MIEPGANLDDVILILLGVGVRLIQFVHGDLHRLQARAIFLTEILDAQFAVFVGSEGVHGAAFGQSQGVELPAGNADDLFVRETFHQLRGDLSCVDSVAQPSEAAVAPREQLVLLRNGGRMALTCGYRDGLPLGQGAELLGNEDVDVLLVIVPESAVATLAPRKDVRPVG